VAATIQWTQKFSYASFCTAVIRANPGVGQGMISAPPASARTTDFSRRKALKLFTAALGSLFLPCSAVPQEEETAQLFGVAVKPFVDALPIPPILRSAQLHQGSPYYRIELTEFRQKLHRDVPATLVWGFDGRTPGPTLISKRDRPIVVDWVNRLPAKHRLAIDHNLHGAESSVPETRAVIHLHGAHVAPESDGHPEDWKVPGQTQRANYPNQQPGATLWYHDHAMGIGRLNMMMGLAGFYLIEDESERHLNLPSGTYDIPVMLQDRVIDPFGQIVYPVSGKPGAPWVPEFFGSHVLVNGKIWPYLEVEPRAYRFRFLNASNARVYRLFLSPGQNFTQIGSDGGLLQEPSETSSVLLAPSERAEVVIDFSGREGRRLTLSNDAPAPYPSGGKLIPHIVMQFRVREASNNNSVAYPLSSQLAVVERIPDNTHIRTRRLSLDEIMDATGVQHRMLLNGKAFMDPVTESPEAGSVEIWEFVNATIDAHPIHLHAVHFQVLDRRGFDTRHYGNSSEIVYRGPVLAPGRGEAGWKDTVLCPPGQVTRIIIRFGHIPGRYVWHCHTLEHEDNEMMRPLVLRPSGSGPQ
jgi:spore coat protein A